jgi:hypothetical protein
VDATIDRVIRRLEEIEVAEMMPFIRGVARKVVSEIHKKSREIPLTEIPEPSDWGNLSEPDVEGERRLECLQKGLSQLKPADRELLNGWYLYDKRQKLENRKRLGVLRGTSATALRVQAFRARQRLQGLVESCLKESSNST